MVVEDDTELRDLFCAVLTERGYQTLPAADGMEALDILEHSYVDLIISDIMMPEMDGFTLTEQLRNANYDMPILIITALDGLEDKRRGFRAGTDDYMVKPIDVNKMVWRVEALLRRSQINSERRITIGSTVLDCDSLTVSSEERTPLSPEGVPASVPPAFLHEPYFHKAAAHGRTVGTGFRSRSPHAGGTHQQTP